MSEEKPSIHKLPLEIMGLIFFELGNNSERRFEEIKRYRVIAPKWFSSVRVHFEENYFEKCLTHFDGLENTYGEAQRFGHNVFGSCKLNFSTLKISNSDYYLMNRWVNRLFTDNLQNLILKDIQLNFKEILRVLKIFSNIVNLEFIQSSRDITKSSKVAEKMCQLYSNPNGKSDLETIEMIKKELVGTEDFLHKLKSINFQVIHASVLNFLILIISCSNCELEEISIDFDLIGIIFCCFWQRSVGANQINFKNFEIGLMTQLNKFSKSLKTIKITAIPQIQLLRKNIKFNYGTHSAYIPPEVKQFGVSRLCQSIFTIFNGHHLIDLKNIEELQLNILGDQFSSIKSGLLYFIKSQKNLSKVEVGVILDTMVPVGHYGPGGFHSQRHEVELELKKTYLESLTSLGVQFGYQISKFGLDRIIQFSANLSILEVGIWETSTWRFSDYQVEFPNCKSLIVRNLCSRDAENRWSNFDVAEIVKKFKNLTSLEFDDQLTYYYLHDHGWERPQIRNEDLQLIIQNYPKLEKLSLDSCIHDLDDSGLTGLTSEALEIRKNSPNIPIQPEERQGLPISHLKNLVELSLYKYYLYRREDGHLNRLRITDLTAMYGFESESPLKYLCLYATSVTEAGAEILKRKLPSNSQLLVPSDYGH